MLSGHVLRRLPLPTQPLTFAIESQAEEVTELFCRTRPCKEQESLAFLTLPRPEGIGDWLTPVPEPPGRGMEACEKPAAVR